MHNSRTHLLRVRDEIQRRLEAIDLHIKDDSNITDLRGQYLDFVGYRINHHRVMLRKRLAENFKRACRTGKKQALPSYYGWIKHANAKRLWYKHMGCHQWKLS